MPPLNWTIFDALAGSRSQNFENLCRGLMRLHYESFGEFRALRNQPGVEFHLKLCKHCDSLGSPPRWWGWQCKVYQTTKTGNLSTAGKKEIRESLNKTITHLPELTDWVLWTPYTLSKADQEWFSELKTNMGLHLWAEEEVDTYLAGPGIILRSTYFGDLAATPDELNRRYAESIQPIKKKFFQQVHHQTEAERTLRHMLGEPGSWDHLIDTGNRLRKASETIVTYVASAVSFPQDVVRKFVHSCETFSKTLLQFHDTLANGDLDIIRQLLTERISLLDDEVKATPRHLRRLAVPIALDATNALHDMRIAAHLLDKVEEFLGVGLIAVMADAGGGKTQLSAAITAPQNARPSGVLLHGGKLHRGGNLNDLARTYTLNGKPPDSFEQLLAALDSAAKRSKCRLPLVIDGLNEAENPRDWKAPLASLTETVRAYPNVLIVCTLRTGERRREHSMWDKPPTSNVRESFAAMALPDGIRRIEGEGFGADAEVAIRRYFDYFKIDPGDTKIPLEFMQHPLTLRIFCEVTNPEHRATVNVGYFPAALEPLFKEYVERSVTRISELPNQGYSYSAEEVRKSIYTLGIILWEQGSRAIEETSYRNEVADTQRQWDCSIVNLLVQEGIIFRNPGDAPYEHVLTPIYDALGGFIIASSLIAKHTQDRSFSWLHELDVINSLGSENSHELASDIFRSLVALAASETNGVQLWKVAPERFKRDALLFATALAPNFLDVETVVALQNLFEENERVRELFYSRVLANHSTVDHPLNAEFLDKILRPITPAGERDLSWTEWIRQTRSKRLSDILAMEMRWKSRPAERAVSDQLRLKWLMWHLTSTDRELRDIATRAIYWFGRGNPPALFEEALKSLEINDPYVPERMLAACYGVAMAHRAEFERKFFTSSELPDFARRLFDKLFADGSPHSTTHILLREYAVRVTELARLYDPMLFSSEELTMLNPPFTKGDLSAWGSKETSEEDGGISHSPSPFGMDFENYTLGRLVPDRGNYDYLHEGYRKTKARILWRIEQLGWFARNFDEIDRRITRDQGLWPSHFDSRRIDRYGKKYSWIAYFEMAGLLNDLGIVDNTYERQRTSDVDIDPSFPERVLKLNLHDSNLLGSTGVEMVDWLANGDQPDMTPYLRIQDIGDYEGPWVALDGFVVQEDEQRGRKSFCFVRSFIVEESSSDAFLERMSAQELGGRWLPEKPSVIYTFGGEIPWCSTYPVNGLTKFSFIENEKVIRVKEALSQLFLDEQPLTCDKNEFLRRNLSQKLFTTDTGELTDSGVERIEARSISSESDEIKRDYTDLWALIPVCDFGWEGYQTSASNAGHAVTLAREISDSLDLVNRPQEFDLFTKDDEKASLNISDHSSDFNNKQSFFFIKECLLRRYLEQTETTLIWVIWGEREYSSKLANKLFREPNRPNKTHGDIKTIHRFEP